MLQSALIFCGRVHITWTLLSCLNWRFTLSEAFLLSLSPQCYTMTTAFQKVITRSYTDVDTKNGINTEEFLEATDGMINMFGKREK